MLTTPLHPYQNESVDKALDRGCLLIAYEMGLGKTIISLAIAEELFGANEAEVAVIVCPAALKYQWAEAIAEHTDVEKRSITVLADGERRSIIVPTEKYAVTIDGTPKRREAQYAGLRKYQPDYVIMGYENVVNDWVNVRKLQRDIVIIDEITAIKSFRAARSKKIKRFTGPFRFGLTGAAIENGKPEELFSQMQWVDEEVLGRFDLYDRAYITRNGWGGVERYKNLPVLHQRLAPAMSRKTSLDPDVAPYLPKVYQKNVWVDLDAKTKKVYKVLATNLLAELKQVRFTDSFDVFAHYHGMSNIDENSQQGRIMAKVQAVDMLLDHPDLIVESGMAYQESERQRKAGVQKKTWPGSKYCYQLWQDGVVDDITVSPKLVAATSLVSDLLLTNDANKIIIFTFWREMLDILQETLPGVSVQYHGEMNPAQKANARARFTQDADCRIFLASHAGAKGTDLYMANYLINYDLAQAAGIQDQINARHVRASSKFDHVRILNMLTKGTTESRNKDRLALKRKVAAAIMDNRGADSKGRIENDLMTLTEHLESTL